MKSGLDIVIKIMLHITNNKCLVYNRLQFNNAQPNA